MTSKFGSSRKVKIQEKRYSLQPCKVGIGLRFPELKVRTKMYPLKMRSFCFSCLFLLPAAYHERILKTLRHSNKTKKCQDNSEFVEDICAPEKDSSYQDKSTPLKDIFPPLSFHSSISTDNIYFKLNGHKLISSLAFCRLGPNYIFSFCICQKCD